MRHVAAGRAIFATRANENAARLAGCNTAAGKLAGFSTLGALTRLAGLLDLGRVQQISNKSGNGVRMKVDVSVVVGGTSITGGRGSLLGTLLGVTLLGAIGPALTFLGVTAYWERAVQGAIILAAVAADALRGRSEAFGAHVVARA